MSLSLVTGAGGFIGRHLVRHLCKQGQSVIGVDLVSASRAGITTSLAGWSAGGLTRSSLEELQAKAGTADVVYHLAGGSSVGTSLQHPAEDFAATVGGTANLLEWIRTSAAQARLVVVSSAAVYGNVHSGPINEMAQTEPYSPYGAHKYAMEAMVRGWSASFNISSIAVRLFSVYGPGLAKQLLWDLSARLHENAGVVMLGGTGHEVRDWTYVGDVVRVLETASSLAVQGMPIMNAGTTVPISVREVAECLALAYGFDPSGIRYSGRSRPGDPFSLVAAPGLLAKLGFDWQVSLQQGLAHYVDWYRSAVSP